MTNPLETILQAVADALEDGEVQLWQPDLTELVLPRPDAAREEPDSVRPEGRSQRVTAAPLLSAPEDAPASPLWEETGALPAWKEAGAGALADELQKTLLPRLEREGEVRTDVLPSGEAGAWEAGEDRSSTLSTPALLERLRTLEEEQAGAEALARGQSAVSTPVSRSGGSWGGGGMAYDPAALGDFPLAAAAAAALEEDRARAVDRAFQRDSRRYDRGFSLY